MNGCPGIMIQNGNTGSANYQGLRIGLNTSSDAVFDQYYASNMVFFTNNAEHLRITSGGNIGIGTNSPSNPLDISGGVAIGSSYVGVTTAPTNGLLVQGNVGIGTTSPSALLQINTTENGTDAVDLYRHDRKRCCSFLLYDTNRQPRRFKHKFRPCYFPRILNSTK